MAHTPENTVSLAFNETVAGTASLNKSVEASLNQPLACTVTKKQSPDMFGAEADDADTLGAEADDAIIMHNASSFKKARLRIVALLITFLLEMIVCFVFSKYTDEFNKYPLLIAFQPVISAISGNVGLQCSSVNVRALAVGLADVRHPGKAVWPEVKASAFLGMTMAILGGTVALFWYETDSKMNTWKGAAAFGFAIGFGMLCSVMTAAVTGSAAPLLFKRCGFDPSAMAGPLETAFQDIIGGTVLLAISAVILDTFGDGGDDSQGCGDCVQACNVDSATVLNLLQSCVQMCLKDVCQ